MCQKTPEAAIQFRQSKSIRSLSISNPNPSNHFDSYLDFNLLFHAERLVIVLLHLYLPFRCFLRALHFFFTVPVIISLPLASSTLVWRRRLRNRLCSRFIEGVLEFAVKAKDSAAFAEFLLKFVDGNAEGVGTGSTKFIGGEGFVILYVVRNGSARTKDVKVEHETESTYIHAVDAKKGDTSKAVDISFGK